MQGCCRMGYLVILSQQHLPSEPITHPKKMQQDTTPYAKFDTVSYPAGNVDPYAQQQQPMQDQQQYYYTNTAPAQPVYGYAQPVVASQSLSHQSSFVQP